MDRGLPFRCVGVAQSLVLLARVAVPVRPVVPQLGRLAPVPLLMLQYPFPGLFQRELLTITRRALGLS